MKFRTLLWPAVAASVAIALAGCSVEPIAVSTEPADREPLTLTVGTLLPLSGALAQFGPATTAAAQLAVDDIAAARAGITIELEARDSGDSASGIATAAVAELLELRPAAIVGPLSNNVARKVVDDVIGARVLQISPGVTGADFSRIADKNLFWRTSAACALEGTVLGHALAGRGAQTVGILYEREFCDGSLAAAVRVAFEAEGGKVVASEHFPAGASSVAAQVEKVAAAKPDVVVVLTRDTVGPAVADLGAAGYSGDKLAFVGLSTTGPSELAGLSGAIATQAGVDVDELGDFTDRLLKVDPALTDFRFAAETYDAVVLIALGALQANSSHPTEIAAQLRKLSGGTGSGTPVDDFAAAAELILSGELPDYDGPSGQIAFDTAGDPLGAIVRIYEYRADSTWKRLE